MVDQFDPRSPTRQELARALRGDQRMIRAFEKLFDLVPTDLIALQKAIADLAIEVNTVMYKADAAIQSIAQLINTVTPTVVQSTDYTTEGDVLVICTAAITVTLNASPADKEKATIIIQNGDVTIDGNGRDVGGLSTIIIDYENLVMDASIDCEYSEDVDEWVVV